MLVGAQEINHNMDFSFHMPLSHQVPSLLLKNYIILHNMLL